MNVPRPLPFEPCEHMEALLDALAGPIVPDLNDGYSDWLACHDHGQSVRIDNEEGVNWCKASSRSSDGVCGVKVWRWRPNIGRWECDADGGDIGEGN